MANVIYSPKDIYDQEFKVVMRGFDKVEVDEFLDNVIQDYELFLAEISALKLENTRLKSQIKDLENELAEAKQAPAPDLDLSYRQPIPAYGFEELEPETVKPTAAASNYDILKRLSRLELEVFGKQIVE